jgi:hypothetical protein
VTIKACCHSASHARAAPEGVVRQQSVSESGVKSFAFRFFILFFNKTIRNRFVACEHTGSQAMAHGAIEEAVQY